jgi:hypothetical protein
MLRAACTRLAPRGQPAPASRLCLLLPRAAGTDAAHDYNEDHILLTEQEQASSCSPQPPPAATAACRLLCAAGRRTSSVPPGPETKSLCWTFMLPYCFATLPPCRPAPLPP